MEQFSILNLGLGGGLRILGSGFVFGTKLIRILQDMFLDNKNPDYPVLLREAFEELGATYIKLGQFIASAPSLFPKEYTQEMEKCLDSVRPLPFSDIRKSVEKELGGDIHRFFRSVEEKPIASASISQVHAAVTLEGYDVVIKVQRPDIESTLKTDMNLIYFSALLFSRIAPELNSSGITDIIRQFYDSILQEVDFIQEKKNMEEFDAYLLKKGETRARVPKVYGHLSTKRVLTMERFYGVALTDLGAIRKYSSDPEETLMNALNIWFESLGQCGLFHADVHAGNLMLLKDGTLGFIDFGIVGRISSQVWQGLMLFMQGMGTENADFMAKGLILMDSTASGINETKFASDLHRVIKEMRNITEAAQRRPEDLDEARINRLMFDISDISKRNGLKIPREFGLLIKQLLYFDRYVKILAPDMDLIRDQKKYLDS
ncbi:MAG TPA: AarF/ABC1/UbiB kinase family protein [Leptospiraceae bacterium]|nr:AarF/ABC1/UbiB kinase family protein [Leptospiraceae bacterium]HMY67751.1 AarF/ABC1/UbiB kinase family protein [Leptospiraceae bacterium]HMZ59715.1 AarF/ABC1/UbiB kinase family protein [Leptospiraceae bacterium]HNF13969.1 AarF/ABC1/UbiB kinase family protein [Leptospiraceae bacterium]HNF25755.1 AarF/ABC1/UbiB kinase family protein [Leptospiraceae bacterium]